MTSYIIRKISIACLLISSWMLVFCLMANPSNAVKSCSPTSTQLPPVTIDENTLNIAVSSFSTASFEVQADGNYVATSGVKDRSKDSYFGQWKNTDMSVVEGSAITIKVSGAVTLCTNTMEVNATPASKALEKCPFPCLDFKKEFGVSPNITKIGTVNNNAFLGFYVPSVPQIIDSPKTGSPTSYVCGEYLKFYLETDKWQQWLVPLYQAEKNYYFKDDTVGFLGTDPHYYSSILPDDLGVVPWAPSSKDNTSGSCNVQIAQSACIARIDAINTNTLAGALQVYVGQDPSGADAAKNSFNVTSTNYTGASPQAGTIWLRLWDPDKNYKNNTNHYNVTVTTGGVINNGSVIDQFITPVKNTLDLVAQQMFIQSVKNTTFQNVVKTLVVLYVVITFMLFTIGFIEEPVQNFMIRTVKIAIVMYLVTNPNSYDFFYHHALGAFIGGRDELIKIVTGGSIADQDLFGFVDKMWSNYFSPTTGQYLQAFYFSTHDGSVSALWMPYLGVITTIWVFALCYALYSYAYCIGIAIMSYMLSYTATALMIVIAPIFVSFLLFDVTKKYFQEYFKYLFMFALQPVILFMMLTILNNMLLLMFAQAFSYPACSVCADVWQPLFAMLGLPGLAIYAVLQPVLCVHTYAITFGNADIVPITMHIIAFLMMTHLMRHVVDFSASFTGFLTGTQEASGGLKLSVDPKKFLDNRSAGKEQGQATKLADKIKTAGGG